MGSKNAANLPYKELLGSARYKAQNNRRIELESTVEEKEASNPNKKALPSPNDSSSTQREMF